MNKLWLIAIAAVSIVLTLFAVPYLSKATVSSDAVLDLSKFKIKVYDSANVMTTLELSIDKPYVAVLHYHVGGYALSTIQRAKTQWQLVVGVEDEMFGDPIAQGDYADTVIKIMLLEDGTFYHEVGVLGSYRKQVYYNNVLKLDTNVQRWVAW